MSIPKTNNTHPGPRPGAEYMTAREVAALLRFKSEDTVFKLVARGKFPPPIPLGRNLRRWRRSAVEEFLRAREGGAP
jgi:excisionase family DNA binding protein